MTVPATLAREYELWSVRLLGCGYGVPVCVHPEPAQDVEVAYQSGSYRETEEGIR